MHDDAKAPKVALVNRQFAVKVFGSVDKAIGGHFKYWWRNAGGSGGRGGRRKIPHADRGSAAGDVLLVSAAAVKRHLAAGAVQPRSARDFPALERLLHGLDASDCLSS